MWFLYVFVLFFNMLFPSKFIGKHVIRNDIESGYICGGPGDVTTNEGGPYDEDPELPELP